MALVNQPAILSGAFAAEGDKNVIPANNDGLAGLASIAKGFPPITQVPLAQGGLPPQRQDFNGIFNLFSQFLLYAQNGGVYAYNNTLDYQPPAIIASDNVFYQCIAENGPSTSAGVQPVTNTTYWEKLVPDVAVMQGASGSAAGKSGLVPAPEIGDNNKFLAGDGTFKEILQPLNNQLRRNQAYQYGDIAYSNNLPSWAYLFCVQAGTTAASEPSFTSINTMGQYITDGTCEWIVDDIRFNTPVGVVFYDTYLHDGCVKINGATVQRSDYKRPFKIATDKNLFYDKDDTYTFTGTTTVSGTTITGISAEDIEKLQTAKEVCGDGILITGTGIPEDCMIDEISTDSVTITVAATAAGSNVKISYGNIHNYPYLYGWGDGETTFVLPDYRARVIQGGDTAKVKAAGLPNITGWFADVSLTGPSWTAEGAFYTGTDYGNATTGTGAEGYVGGMSFAASKSSAIYGVSETVQPPAIRLILQAKI